MDEDKEPDYHEDVVGPSEQNQRPPQPFVNVATLKVSVDGDKVTHCLIAPDGRYWLREDTDGVMTACLLVISRIFAAATHPPREVND